MATTKPRIAITLEPEHYQVIKRISSLKGTPMSSVVVEFLVDVMPILENLATALESVKTASEEAKAKFVRTAENAEQELLPLAEFVQKQFMIFANEIGRIEHETVVAGESVEEPRTAPARSDEIARTEDERGTDTDSPAGRVPRPVITGATVGQRTDSIGRKMTVLAPAGTSQRSEFSDEI